VLGYYPNLFSVFAIANPSVCRLSVCLPVTLVHPTQEVKPFGNISSPLCTLAIVWSTCTPLNARGVAK